MSKITVYHNTSDRRVMNKNITPIKTYECKFLESTGITNPKVVLNKKINGGDAYRDFQAVNYAYLEVTNRYFFVKDINLMVGGMIQLELEVDVLLSFKSQLLECSGLCLRNEYNVQPYYVDELLPFLSGRIIERYNVPNTGDISFSQNGFNSLSNCFAITVTGNN